MTSQNSTTFRACHKSPTKCKNYEEDYSAAALQDQIRDLPQYRGNKCTELLQTSNFPKDSFICRDANGFVNTVVNCYNDHHNLILRPDDVWVAIMTQFSFYINKHSEEFRGKFVDFKGKRTLVVAVPDTSLRTAPYDLMVKVMSKEIDKNLVDPEMKKWILPSFSTTTNNDLVTAGVVFMASMKKYFDYVFVTKCGIPNITLEGTVEDWEDIRRRLKKLKDYKLKKWYGMLKPILTQFVNAKKRKVDLGFWDKICHYKGWGSGPSYLCGWITTFCVFNEKGEWHGRRNFFNGKWIELDTNDIPTGIVEVEVKVVDVDGAIYNTVMFAGHMAAEIKEDECTLQPTLGWAIALKPNSDDDVEDEN